MLSSDSVPDDARKHKEDREDADASTMRAVTIGLPRNEIFAFLKNYANLPLFMDKLVRVDVLDGGRTHWVMQVSDGKTVEWDSTTTEIEPDRLIAWEADQDAQMKSHGWIELRDAAGGRGTEVHAAMSYEAPGGALAKLMAELFHKGPGADTKPNLRRLKMLLETGEIATTEYPDAAPRYKAGDASDDAKAAETR